MMTMRTMTIMIMLVQVMGMELLNLFYTILSTHAKRHEARH